MIGVDRVGSDCMQARHSVSAGELQWHLCESARHVSSEHCELSGGDCWYAFDLIVCFEYDKNSAIFEAFDSSKMSTGICFLTDCVVDLLSRSVDVEFELEEYLKHFSQLLGDYRNTNHNRCTTPYSRFQAESTKTFAYHYYCTLDTSNTGNSLNGVLKMMATVNGKVETIPLVRFDVLPVFGEWCARELRAFAYEHSWKVNGRFTRPTYENICNYTVPV